jgi:hypothetical protein
MMRMMPWVLAMALMATGCRWFTKGQSSSATYTGTAGTTGAPAGTSDAAAITPDTTPTGTVARVNAAARFVILNFPVGGLPEIGQTLYVYRHGLKVGEVKVTAPQQDDNTAADIATGEADVGDEIRVK